MLNRRSFVLSIAVVIVAACSSAQDMAAAEAAVTRFRERVAALDFATVYAESDEDLRKNVSEQDLTKFLAAVTSKLGSITSSEKATWNVNVGTSGTFITLGYKTEFAKGTGTEQFVYRIRDGAAVLHRYDINSPALVIN